MSPERNSAPLVPPRLNLDNQRKRARSLLKAARALDERALQRLAAVHPRFCNSSAAVGPRWSLHHAQLVIAREQGFASWAKLKTHIASSTYPLMPALVEVADRALETERAEPLFRDPFARALAGDEGMSLHAALRTTTWPPNTAGPSPELSILTRYFDDALLDAVRKFRIEQVLVLGGCMDTRAFRLSWPKNLVLFEVEQPAVFERKEAVLRELGARPRCERRILPSELDGAWQRRLLAAGFATDRPAAILIPTTLVTLEPTDVARLFRGLRQIACTGSWLGVPFFGLDTIDSPFMKPFIEKQMAFGWPRWRFGVRDPETFLAGHGWDAESVVAGAPEVSYGRWRYGYVPRTRPDRGIPRLYMAQATAVGEAPGDGIRGSSQEHR